MIKISAYLVTKNEEKRLPATLSAISAVADEIVVVDSGSTDKTMEIALLFGARFIHNDWISIGHQVKFAEEQCINDWVLRLDADEVLSDALIQEILNEKNNPEYDAYYLRIGDMFPGYSYPKRWVKHYKLIRFYNKKKLAMSGRLGHDDVVPLAGNIKTKILYNFVKHYSYTTLHELLEKRNIETDRQVSRAILEHKNYSPWRMFGAVFFNTFKFFILYRYFLFGWWGFIISLDNAYMRFLKFAKFYEYHKKLEHNNT